MCESPATARLGTPKIDSCPPKAQPICAQERSVIPKAMPILHSVSRVSRVYSAKQFAFNRDRVVKWVFTTT